MRSGNSQDAAAVYRKSSGFSGCLGRVPSTFSFLQNISLPSSLLSLGRSDDSVFDLGRQFIQQLQAFEGDDCWADY